MENQLGAPSTTARRVESQERSHNATLMIVALLDVFVKLATIAIVVIVALDFLPPNPFSFYWVTLPNQAIAATLPQGWGFFTKSPRDDFFLIYRRDAAGVWKSIYSGPESEPRNAFGWSRYPRQQGIDLGILLGTIGANDHTGCVLNVDRCLQEAPFASVDERSKPEFTLCGDIGLVFEKPIPWTWAREFAKITVHSRTIRLRVTCAT